MLRSQIVTGKFPVGEVLPTEHSLMRIFNVSRATVRSALKDLTNEGLIKGKPGVGTIVIRSRPEIQQSRLRGLTEDLKQQGISTDAVVISASLEEPTPAVRHHLELAAGEKALQLVRQRKIAGTPFALITSFVPASLGITPDEDFSGPLYQLLERTHRLHIIYGRDVITARAANECEAQALNVLPGTPILFIRRTAYIEHDRPVEYVEASIRTDLYEYAVTLPR